MAMGKAAMGERDQALVIEIGVEGAAFHQSSLLSSASAGKSAAISVGSAKSAGTLPSQTPNATPKAGANGRTMTAAAKLPKMPLRRLVGLNPLIAIIVFLFPCRGADKADSALL
jgi:hypothetical protein